MTPRRLPTALAPAVLALALVGGALAGCAPTAPGTLAEELGTDAPTAVATAAEEVTEEPTETPVDEEESGDASSGSSGSSGSGSGSSGSSGSETSGSGSSGSGSSGSGSTTATTEPEPEDPAAAVAVIQQKCSSGRLTVTLTASYDSSYRKGITKVVLERANEYGAWIDANATWMTADTGNGDQWTGQPPGSKTQRFQDEVRITASFSGGSTVVTVPITVNC